MKVLFKESFARDLRAIKDRDLLSRVKAVIEAVEQAQSLDAIGNVRKLKGGSQYYRIRLGDYRLGLVVQENVVTFVRCLHRKDIYRYFP